MVSEHYKESIKMSVKTTELKELLLLPLYSIETEDLKTTITMTMKYKNELII